MRVFREAIKALLITASMAALLLVLLWKIQTSAKPNDNDRPVPPPAPTITPPPPAPSTTLHLARYALTDLGTLAGYADGPVQAFGINDRGQVVGQAGDMPFLWQNGKMTGPDGGVTVRGGSYEQDESYGYGHGSAQAINGVGEIAGWFVLYQGDVHFSDLTNPVAYIWLKGDMIDWFGGQQNSAVMAINDHNGSAGYAALPTGQLHAVLWETSQGLLDLGTLPAPKGVTPSSEAMGINNRIQVVGTSSNGAFLWERGHMKSLGPGAAYAINDSGVIVGESQDRACIWIHRRRRYLPVPAGCKTSGAMAINILGEVVGEANNDAVLWSHRRVIDLNKLVPASAGWQLTEATGINNHGWVVGSGQHNDLARGFLLTPTMARSTP